MQTTRLSLNSTGAVMLYRVNDGSGASTGTSHSAGHYAARRTGAAARDAWKSGVLTASDTTASTSIATELTLLAASSVGTNASNARLAAAYAGGALTAAQMPEMHTALQTYMQAVGAA